MSACPICRASVRPRAKNPIFPFCSERCKALDLGRWLTEAYRIAAEQAPDETEQRGDPEEA